ncbi:hypothetical protein QR680_008308 [Steinernema hermaphroditum]|uniref:Uncharacterized protein n=1 Tax=Steinernema hermaphroditum TaxID=289476 RepID=A0AA39II71_9BILA|nr:hypothetical protein QR680_008308 [Steinernema hermaphroditum]
MHLLVVLLSFAVSSLALPSGGLGRLPSKSSPLDTPFHFETGGCFLDSSSDEVCIQSEVDNRFFNFTTSVQRYRVGETFSLDLSSANLDVNKEITYGQHKLQFAAGWSDSEKRDEIGYNALDDFKNVSHTRFHLHEGFTTSFCSDHLGHPLCIYSSVNTYEAELTVFESGEKLFHLQQLRYGIIHRCWFLDPNREKKFCFSQALDVINAVVLYQERAVVRSFSRYANV